MALLGDAPHEQAGGAGDVRTRPRVGPRRPGEPLGDGDIEQRMPGRVEVDFVHPVAVPVVGAQPRREAVRLLTPLLSLLPTGEPAQPVQVADVPARALTHGRFQQHRVGGHVVPG
jgi:hypothetical protein